jgi:hypothetical protein
VRDVRAERAKRATTQRTCAKLIRFSPEELRTVLDRARSAGRPVACYVREASQGVSPRTRKSELSDAVIRALSRIGNHLQVLSREATEQRLPCAPDFERAVGEVLNVIRAID